MKKFSKALSVGVAAVLVSSTLAACGGDKEKTGNSSKGTESEKTTVASTDKVTEKKTEKPTESQSEAMGQLTTINVYSRDEASGTRGAFEELIDFKGQLLDTAAIVESNGDMATKVGQDTGAIGYVSLTTDFEKNNLKPISYEGVVPSAADVINGSYTLKRPFSYVTRAKGDFPSEEVEQLVDAFIDFINNSTEGLEAVHMEGGIVDVDAGKPWAELKANHPIVDQDNSAIQIRTAGSTSVIKTLDAAINAFKPLAGNVDFVSDHNGSGDGFKRTLGEEKDGANGADIGFASREFKDDETVSQGAYTGQYAQDAVVVVVQKDNKIENLTKQQVFDIFTGAVTDWSDLK